MAGGKKNSSQKARRDAKKLAAAPAAAAPAVASGVAGGDARDGPEGYPAAEPVVMVGPYRKYAAPAPVAAPGVPEELKQAGNALYLKDDYLGAIEKYSLAIASMVSIKGEEPEGPEDRKALSILYGNRAQAALAILRKAYAEHGCAAEISKEHRPHAMRAHSDCAEAVELDDANAKAWLRKGQALLWMSSMPQRAKEAVRCFEKAKSGNLPESLAKEADQSLQYGKAIFDQQTPMPENMPKNCVVM